MLFHEQPTDPWQPYDFKLLEAYQVLQDETCQMCGHPLWLCRSTDPNLEFRVQTAVCQAKAALEKADKKRENNKRELKPGEYAFTVPKMLFKDMELPTREEWVKNTIE